MTLTKEATKSPGKSADSKESIFKEAARLFAMKGFEGTSVRDISGAASVNVALINYHFKTKENLFNEVVRYGFKEMEEYRASLRGKPLLEMLELIFRRNIDLDSWAGYYLSVVMNIFTSPQRLNDCLAKEIADNPGGQWMEGMIEAVRKEVPASVPQDEIVKVSFMINAYLTWLSQVSFGLNGLTTGFIGEMYKGPDEVSTRVNVLVDQAKKLVELLNLKYQ